MRDIQYEWLSQYLSVVREPRPDAIYSVDAQLLTDQEQIKLLLLEYKRQIHGSQIDVAGTYFASSWRTVCAAMIYMTAMTDVRLDLSPANLNIQIDCGNGYPQLLFVLKSATELAWPTGERTEWQRNSMEQFYRSLQPIMSAISAVTGLPLSQLWGQIPLGAEYYVNLLSGLFDEEQHREHLLEAYGALTKHIDCSYFGLKRNPFDVKEIWLDDPYKLGEQTRMKPTCCLAYLTGDGYCYTCPKLSNQDRQERYQEIRSAYSQ